MTETIEDEDHLEILKMKFHESKRFHRFTVLKVHKGWIYTFTDRAFCQGVGDQFAMTSVFVPR